METPRKNKFVVFLKNLFVKNVSLKLLALALSVFTFVVMSL